MRRLQIIQVTYDSSHKDYRMGQGPQAILRRVNAESTFEMQEVDGEDRVPMEIGTSFTVARQLAGRVCNAQLRSVPSGTRLCLPPAFLRNRQPADQRNSENCTRASASTSASYLFLSSLLPGFSVSRPVGCRLVNGATNLVRAGTTRSQDATPGLPMVRK